MRIPLRVLVILASAAAIANAQARGSGPGVAAPTPTSQPSYDSAVLVALRAQNMELRDHQDRLLSTVLWSLGAVGLLVTVVVGFGAYLNLRLYDRDKAALEQSLQGSLVEQLAALERRTSERQREYETELRDQVKVIQESAARSGEAAASSIGTHLGSQIGALEQKLQFMQMHMLESKAELWQMRKVHSNAIRAYVSMLELAIEMNWEAAAARALDGVESGLKRGARLDAQDVSELSAVLARLPSHFAPIVRTIHRLIDAKPTEDATGT